MMGIAEKRSLLLYLLFPLLLGLAWFLAWLLFKISQFISGRKKKLPARQQPDRPETRKLDLAAPTTPFSGRFQQILAEVLTRRQEIIASLAPFFLGDHSGPSSRRIFPFRRAWPEIEHLYLLWQQGNRDHRLPFLFVLYYFATEHELAEKIFFELMTYREMPADEKLVLNFLFQDIAGKNIATSEPALAAAAGKFPWLAFNLQLEKDSSHFTRQNFPAWPLPADLRLLPTGAERELYHFLLPRLEKTCNYLLWRRLWQKYNPVTFAAPEKLSLRQAFFYGHYHRLVNTAFPEEARLWLAGGKKLFLQGTFSDSETSELENNLKKFDYHPWHLFYFLLRTNPQSEKIASLEFPQETIGHWLEAIDQGGFLPNEKPSCFLLWVTALVFISRQKPELAEKLRPFCGSFPRKNRLLEARAWLAGQEPDKAFALVHAELQKNPENLPLMNEAAIYAFYAGKWEESEHLFSLLKSHYPESGVFLHNEAVFFEEKSRLEIDARWKKLQENRQAKDSN